jgi:DNA-binding transcriptional LysR family regulator
MLREGAAEADESEGRMIRLLPDWSAGFVHDVNLVMGSSQLPRRVRLFVDFVLSRMA